MSNPSTYVCAKCGKTLRNTPHHIEGIGNLGPECYRHVAGLEQLLEHKFNRWMPHREAMQVRDTLNRLGLKYKQLYRGSDERYCYIFEGFKRASSKPKGAVLTFADIRKQYAEWLQRASETRRQQVAA
jgi:hypothetical protein